MIKIYLLIVVLGVLGGVGYGGYAYYQDTQERLRIYAENQARLEEAVKTSEATIQKMGEDILKQQELNNELQKNLTQATAAQDALRRTLTKHDLTKEALNDPINSQERMNNATKKVWARIESVTGNDTRKRMFDAEKAAREDSNKDGVQGKGDTASEPSKTN